MYLEEQRQNKKEDAVRQKRKAAVPEELVRAEKKRKANLESVIPQLEADMFKHMTGIIDCCREVLKQQDVC